MLQGWQLASTGSVVAGWHKPRGGFPCISPVAAARGLTIERHNQRSTTPPCTSRCVFSCVTDAMHGWQLMATTQAAFLHGCVGFPCACPSKLLALMCRCCRRLCGPVACSLTGLCWVTLCFGLLPLLLLSRQPPWSWHRQPGRTRHGSQGEWGGQQSERLLHRCTCNGQSICATCSAY